MEIVKKRNKRNVLVGNSGEYFVMAKLLEKGIIAALAPRNSNDFDILATNGKNSVNIRVKTKSSSSIVWQFRAKKDGNIYKNISNGKIKDVICLVSLNKEDDPYYHLISTREINRIIKRDFRGWVKKPGKHGEKHDKTKLHRIFGQTELHKNLLQKSKDNWSILGLNSNL